MNIDITVKGKQLGMKLVRILKEIGVIHGCYKVLLDCADHNIQFYELVMNLIMNKEF